MIGYLAGGMKLASVLWVACQAHICPITWCVEYPSRPPAATASQSSGKRCTSLRASRLPPPHRSRKEITSERCRRTPGSDSSSPRSSRDTRALRSLSTFPDAPAQRLHLREDYIRKCWSRCPVSVAPVTFPVSKHVGHLGVADGSPKTAISSALKLAAPPGKRQPNLDPDVGIRGWFGGSFHAAESRQVIKTRTSAVCPPGGTERSRGQPSARRGCSKRAAMRYGPGPRTTQRMPARPTKNQSEALPYKSLSQRNWYQPCARYLRI